jgi:hypothetical protein
MLVVDGDEWWWWPWRQTCRTAAALASLSGLLTACVSAQSFVVAVVAIRTRAADPMNYVANRPSIRGALKRSEVGGSGAVCVVWSERLMSGRRRGEQHCHMQYEERDKTVRLCTKDVSRCSAALFGGVGSRPSAACEEDSHHAMPCHANLQACDPERAEHPIGSVGL